MYVEKNFIENCNSYLRSEESYDGICDLIVISIKNLKNRTIHPMSLSVCCRCFFQTSLLSLRSKPRADRRKLGWGGDLERPQFVREPEEVHAEDLPAGVIELGRGTARAERGERFRRGAVIAAIGGDTDRNKPQRGPRSFVLRSSHRLLCIPPDLLRRQDPGCLEEVQESLPAKIRRGNFCMFSTTLHY